MTIWLNAMNPRTIAVGALSLAMAAANGASVACAGEAPLARDPAAGLEWGPCPSFMPEGCGLAVLHGNPAEHNADVFFRLPGNTVAERHWHSSAERMLLVTGELHVEYDGEPTVVLRPGVYAYGPPRLPHAAKCVSSEACLLFIAFEEPVDAVQGAPD